MTAESKPARQSLRIILDANALFVPLQFNIDIFDELKRLLNRNLEPILLSSTRQELQTIVEQGNAALKKKAAFALKLAERCTLINADENKGASSDDLILRAADKYKYPVFTNDRKLRNKLRNINVPVVYVRHKSRLEIDGRL